MKKIAIGKISWNSLPPKQHLDSQLDLLIRGGAPDALIADFIREHYFPFALLYAADMLGGSRSERLADDAADLATTTMENILARAEAGTLGFRGAAAFSGYLQAAVSRTVRAARRINYPTEIRRLGLPAMNAYRMVLLDGAGEHETARYLAAEHHLSQADIMDILRCIGGYRNAELQRQSKRPGGVSVTSLDALREGPGGDGGPGRSRNSAGSGNTAAGGFEPAARTPGPEQQLLRSLSLEALARTVERLGEPARSVIRGYLLEGRWASIADMEEALGLKNGTYELKKAKEELRRLLES